MTLQNACICRWSGGRLRQVIVPIYPQSSHLAAALMGGWAHLFGWGSSHPAHPLWRCPFVRFRL